jgi:hypothetical protein
MAQTTVPVISTAFVNTNDQFTATFTQVAAGAIPTMAFWVAPVACKVISGNVSWGTAAGAASTIGLFKDATTVAAGDGTAILSAAVDFATAADANNAMSLSATPADYTFAAGNKLSTKVVTGTATGSAKVSWTVLFQRV